MVGNKIGIGAFILYSALFEDGSFGCAEEEAREECEQGKGSEERASWLVVKYFVNY